MPFLFVDKEEKMTSNDVIKIIKKKFDYKKVGHSGTLDPFATGLLIIGIGSGTKILGDFLNSKKKYIGVVKFGIETDTLDKTGKILNEDKTVNISLKDLRKIITENFLGKISQVPPQYSAIKVNGKRAYKYARNNEVVKLKPKKRIIYSLDIKKVKKNIFSFEVLVSSGTYIRSLFRDIAKKLDTLATLEDLMRTQVGDIKIEKSKKVGKISEKDLMDFKDVLNYREVSISLEEGKKLLEGKKIDLKIDKEMLFARTPENFLILKRGGFQKYKLLKFLE